MSRIVNEINVTVQVPPEDLCNEKPTKETIGNRYCKFMRGPDVERHCTLFGKALYTHAELVKKCNECLNMTKLESEVNEDE
jgi:hypothetical protein